MDELRTAPVRPLDPFEARYLPALQTGGDLKTESAGGHIRMLGSIRAAKQCLACHSVDHGALLGAFSYELVRDKPQDEQREPAEDEKPEPAKQAAGQPAL